MINKRKYLLERLEKFQRFLEIVVVYGVINAVWCGSIVPPFQQRSSPNWTNDPCPFASETVSLSSEVL